jgi:hypothetical protein
MDNDEVVHVMMKNSIVLPKKEKKVETREK